MSRWDELMDLDDNSPRRARPFISDQRDEIREIVLEVLKELGLVDRAAEDE